MGAELAAVNQFLRGAGGAPGGGRSLGDVLRAKPGYELALAAVLGARLRAALADDLVTAQALLADAGRDGGAALVLRSDCPATGRLATHRRRAPPSSTQLS